MVSVLIFLATFNLAGFTILPYMFSKTSGLTGFMPVALFHKIFILSELVFIGLFFSVAESSYVQFFYLFGFVCLANLVFNFRYVANKVINFQIPKVHIGSLSSDFEELKSFVFVNTNNADYASEAVVYENDRVMTDLVLFVLNSLIILFYYL